MIDSCQGEKELQVEVENWEVNENGEDIMLTINVWGVCDSEGVEGWDRGY